MASLERVMFALSLVAWGCDSSSDGDELPLGMGGSAGTRAAEAGRKQGGTGGANSTGGGAGAGQRGGRGGTGGTTMTVTAGESACAAGEGGATPNFCAADILDEEGAHWPVCGLRDCVSDCSSGVIVHGVVDDCGVRCPPEAPVPASDCAQPCGRLRDFACGPGLYCTGRTVEDEAWECVSGERLRDCACQRVPESCSSSDDDRWVCASNGRAYRNSCEAERDRVRLTGRNSWADCPPPRDDLFQCGSLFCLKDLEVCHIDVGPNDHDEDYYACDPAGGAGGAGGESGAGAGGR